MLNNFKRFYFTVILLLIIGLIVGIVLYRRRRNAKMLEREFITACSLNAIIFITVNPS